MAGEGPETDVPKVDWASSHSERRMVTQKTLDAEQKLPADSKANLDRGINANKVQLIYDGAGTATAKRAADHCVPQWPEPQGLDDSESVVSELIKRLKESLSEQAGSWWRASMAKVANRPLLASYETSSDEVFSRTAQIQDELVSGPNENSVFSSNWHDRLQWAFHRVLALRESQDSRSASQLRRRLFERELGLSHEIGSFAAAARAAAVVLLHSLALEEKAPFTNQPQPTRQEQPRKGPAQCFVRIKPGEYPTLWSVYRPKFADDQVYVFDSLVLTVIVGEAQANVKTNFAKEVYLNDIKGRQAMADAVYATSFARKLGRGLHPRSCSQLRYSQQRNLQNQVDTVWDLHDQNKFERAKLGLPIACLIDYAGFAVLVEPLLPLSPAPVNVLEELVADIRRRLPDFAQQCGSIGNPLGCFDALDKVDRATYHKFKNIAGFLNLAEQRFRQEFVSRVFHVALPCTSREQHKAAEVSASNLFQRHVTIRGTMETLSLAVRSLDLAIKQDLVPTINALQKNFLDSYDVSHALHSHGINIRNMAQLLDHGPSSPFKDAIIREIVARSAKHLFRLQVEKLIGSGLVETSHIEEIQRLVVKLFNLVLSKNEESRIFWRHQILPLALERYKVDLSDLASPENVCTFSLFKAMEYNLSVQYDDSVAVRSNDSSGEASLELRLPLTVADLSTFSTGRDSLLFAHVSQIRAALLGSYSAETRPHDDEGDSGTQLRSTKQLMRHFENAGRDKERGEGSKLGTPCTVEELKTFAELRAVRGFYPRVHLVAPDTLALMQAAVASTAVGSSSTPLDVLLDNMKAGTGYPCHPYCLAFDEDEMLHEAFLKMADENRAQSPLKQCLRYKRRKLALTLALLSKAAIDQPQDALICYRNLKPILVAMEGKMSLRLLLAHLMLASFAFKNKRFNSAILHAFRVHRISTVCFDTGGAHWAAVAALRLIARSMLEVQRCSEAVIILQHTVRAATANPELPTLVTHMSRFWLAAAFARMGRLENASVEAQNMLAGLESQLGANHEATISALYLAAEVKMRIGCLALQNPPLKILGTGSEQHSTENEICGAPSELQEPLLWKPLTAEDFEVYEEIFRDREMIQARALVAHRIYVACVAQSCSSAVRTFGLMEQDQVAESEQENGDGNSVGPLYLGADRTKVYFKKYPRLQVGRRRTSAASPRHLTTAASTDMRTKLARQVEEDSHPDYPFSFYSQQKVSGTGRRNVHGHDVLYARVDGSSGLRPAQEHDDIMLQLLLFGKGPSSLNGVLKSCYMSCLEDRDRNPSTWFDDMISDVLTERGSLQHLRFLICMLRHFFTLSQKSLFITLALGDFNRKHAKIFVQTMRTQEIEAEVSRKLVLKRMINKSREEMPESTDDYFEYDFNSPRPFDLTIGISQCEDLLNSTTWTGSALRVARSQLDFTLTKQSLTKQGPTQAWQQFISESEPLDGAGADDEKPLRATVGAQRSDLAAVEENYLKIPPVGKGNISGKTTWRSMSTAARLSQIRFGGSKHLITNMPPIAYGVMRDIFKPQHDSELEAFGCIECLQPPDKVPFIGG
ncbi:hypothetical protein, conserved [Eimeria necatrix]|uniref:Clu domain-containing protein n=1 Tax=Eimeria necatrix TaxID=51315 RepID=U6MH88_9EIME|nr:hypothetical protein, conserved [Eimeria necatrix]CDJ62433.1 hypothetical protein, conserved [Eimeria necatrix]